MSYNEQSCTERKRSKNTRHWQYTKYVHRAELKQKLEKLGSVQDVNSSCAEGVEVLSIRAQRCVPGMKGDSKAKVQGR